MINGFQWSFSLLALGIEREIDHHDRVLLHDANEQNDSNKRDDAEIGTAKDQREQRAHSGGRQRRKDRDRMNVAFIKNAQNDVDGHKRREN